MRQVTVSLARPGRWWRSCVPTARAIANCQLARVKIPVVDGQATGRKRHKGYGGREGYARFIETRAWREAADGAIREALVNLNGPGRLAKWMWCWGRAGPA